MDALEMFGADGSRHTMDYEDLVRSLEVWEIDEAYGSSLRKNLPQAHILITDSFAELQKTASRYDLIVIDTPTGLYGPEPHHCDHYDLFTPALFRILRPSAVVILNVSPQVRRYDTGTTEGREYLARRRAFYDSSHPESVPIDMMVKSYRSVANSAGFDVEWYVAVRRTWLTKQYYLALGVKPLQLDGVAREERGTLVSALQ